MAVKVSCATGNFTSAATWKVADATTYNNTELSFTNPPTVGAASNSRLTAGQTTGAITIDAIGLKIASRVTSPSGTMTVQLYNTTGSSVVSGTTVTINVADLPAITSNTAADGGWHVFKFASPVTLSAATAYAVEAITSVASQVTIFKTATGGDWARFLRTTTTGAPAAGDDLIIAGEYTGAGTSNTYTVTMDSTATTAYGSQPVVANSLFTPAVAVCNKATLAYGTTAATNYVLRLNGCLIVYRGGVFNIGTVATPIPRDGTAVLEFGQAATGADGDYGLIIRDGGTWTSQGLSRTVGKNIDRALLSGGGYVGSSGGTAQGFSATTTSASPNLTAVSAVAFGTFAVGDSIGQHGSVTAIPANTTVLGYRDSSGVDFGDTTGISANSTIKMSANAVSSTTLTFAVYTNTFNGSRLITVDTDTGWLLGDQIAIASTTRTASDCETCSLTANATATRMAVSNATSAVAGQALPLSNGTALGFRHDGISPVQAEVILLTRNIKIRSTSATLMAYVKIGNSSVAPTAITVDVDWTEFYYLGANSIDKRGLDIDCGTGSAVSVQYSSIHDCEAIGVNINTGGLTTDGLTFSNNVQWACATVTGPAIQFFSAASGVTWVMDSNIIMRTLNGNCVTLADIGGTFTNNRAIGATSVGMGFAETSTSFGNFSGNIAHSNTSVGINPTGAGQSGTLSNSTTWRNNASGFRPANAADLVIDGIVAFGNSTTNLEHTSGGDIRYINPVVNGDSSFSTNNGLLLSQVGQATRLVIDGGDFSSVSGIKNANTTADIQVGGNSLTFPQIVLRNTKLGATTEVGTQTSMISNAYIASQKHDQTAGNHKTWKRDGTISSDATIYKTASPSERLAPNNLGASLSLVFNGTSTASIVATNQTLVVGRFISVATYLPNGAYITAVNQAAGTITLSTAASSSGTASGSVNAYGALTSGSKLVAVASGGSATIGVWVRKSAAGDGTAYQASTSTAIAQPRLIQKANPAIGLSADTVRATASAAAGTWEQLTYTITNSSGDDAVFEFCIDCSGQQGWVNVDDWSVS